MYALWAIATGAFQSASPQQSGCSETSAMLWKQVQAHDSVFQSQGGFFRAQVPHFNLWRTNAPPPPTPPGGVQHSRSTVKVRKQLRPSDTLREGQAHSATTQQAHAPTVYLTVTQYVIRVFNTKYVIRSNISHAGNAVGAGDKQDLYGACDGKASNRQLKKYRKPASSCTFYASHAAGDTVGACDKQHLHGACDSKHLNSQLKKYRSQEAWLKGTLWGRQAYLRVARMLGWCSSLQIRASRAGVISGVRGVSVICTPQCQESEQRKKQ